MTKTEAARGPCGGTAGTRGAAQVRSLRAPAGARGTHTGCRKRRLACNVQSIVCKMVDQGTSLNPLVDLGQVEGALLMSLGYFMTEEVCFADDGSPLTLGCWEYSAS